MDTTTTIQSKRSFKYDDSNYDDSNNDDDTLSVGSDSLASELEEIPTDFPPTVQSPSPPTSVENIIVNKNDLSKLLQSFHCARCRAPVRGIEYSTIGIATKVLYCCYKCNKEVTIDPEVITTNQLSSNSGKFLERISSYALNLRLILSTHLIGRSNAAAAVFCSFMGLSSSAFKTEWYSIEDDIGVHIRNIAGEIVEQNIREECDGLEANDDGYIPIDVSGDGAWQQGGEKLRFYLRA